MHTSTLVYMLRLGSFVVNKNCEGITHEESIIVPQPGGPCLNWVMGHIVRTRNDVLELLGRHPPYRKADLEIYHPRVFNAGGAIDIIRLREFYNALQKPVEEGVQSLHQDKMDQPSPFSPTGNAEETTGSLLAAVVFHEASHAGQLGTLRRLLGKPGVIKSPTGE